MRGVPVAWLLHTFTLPFPAQTYSLFPPAVAFYDKPVAEVTPALRDAYVAAVRRLVPGGRRGGLKYNAGRDMLHLARHNELRWRVPDGCVPSSTCRLGLRAACAGSTVTYATHLDDGDWGGEAGVGGHCAFSGLLRGLAVLGCLPGNAFVAAALVLAAAGVAYQGPPMRYSRLAIVPLSRTHARNDCSVHGTFAHASDFRGAPP